MSAVLAGVGSGIFVLLGVAHAVFTLQSTPDGGPMTPTDPAVREAMQINGGLGLAPHLQTNLFRAWTGFNLSHSLGVAVIGGILLYRSMTDFGAAADDVWFVVLAIAAPLAYLVLALRFWFDQPRNAILVATLLIWSGTAIQLL